MDSWRSILERAAENLSVELSDKPIYVSRAAYARPNRFSRRQQRPLTFEETRNLLARELEAIPAMERPSPQATILQDVKHKKRRQKHRAYVPDTLPSNEAPLPPAADRKSRGGGLAALILSVSGVALTLCGIYIFLR
jgi:hypothetical protein